MLLSQILARSTSILGHVYEAAVGGDINPTRDFFYVGGHYENFTYMIGQIYVERLTPPKVTEPYPIVFIAGSGQTGTNFLKTPDSRPGWSSHFLSAGYVVYLTDQPSRGRSPWYPGIGSVAAFDTHKVETLFTAPEDYGLWPQAHLHTQWPGTGHPGDPVFDSFYATQVQLQANELISEETNARAYSALLDRIGPAYLITRSQAGAYGWRIGDARPHLVKDIVALEPSGPPFENAFPFKGRQRTWGITALEISYEPSAGPNATALHTVTVAAKDEEHTSCILQAEPAKRLKNLSRVNVLVVTAEASFHQPYDYCTVLYLRQAGVKVEFLDLGEVGVRGNGHMMFMELNGEEIAGRVGVWLKKQRV
ncbi:alpha/beta-hydrolase [Mytilinidion resinicola]|uniref:Alpha/beta-hydrolase n=1 Tax=Mytilinidion resinicola TaxID=574789 RepID=A0A6A6YR53_9PEZI|nr:alpha/beta-hydrolase [Mytilinidion resinicola]KAF2811396.1 alpha/beta-hydrolase [Mytilinidion resinicola]